MTFHHRVSDIRIRMAAWDRTAQEVAVQLHQCTVEAGEAMDLLRAETTAHKGVVTVHLQEEATDLEGRTEEGRHLLVGTVEVEVEVDVAIPA